MVELGFTIGSVIKLMREKKGLGQHELGVHKVTVSQIELGNREPKMETLKTIAKKLGTTESEIYALVDRLNGRITSRPSQASACPDENQEHLSYHEKIERIFHENPQLGELLAGSIDNFYAALQRSPGSAGSILEGQHGPVRPLHTAGRVPRFQSRSEFENERVRKHK